MENNKPSKLPNIITRILAGGVFVGLLLGGLFINEYTFCLIFSILTVLCLYEFYRLIEKSTGINVSIYVSILGGLVLFWSSYLYNSLQVAATIGFAVYLLFLLILCVRELYMKHENPIKSLAYCFFGQVYIALPFALTNFIVFISPTRAYSYVFLFAILIMIWVNDSFAYLTGMAFGKHRLFERISPKKSWEGFLGGAIFAIAASLVFSHFYGNIGVIAWIGFAVVVVVAGTWGDLCESLMKRTLGVKDSGTIIPGHGGILDRLDSTLFAIPAIYIYLTFLAFFS